MKFLVDEDLSLSIAAKLPSLGHAASHVAHIGLASTKDRAFWNLALDRDEVVITANARDFLKLATGVDFHPGLIVLREGALLTGTSSGIGSRRRLRISTRRGSPTSPTL